MTKPQSAAVPKRDRRSFRARLYDLMVEVRGERFADSMAIHIAQGVIYERGLYRTLIEMRDAEARGVDYWAEQSSATLSR